jgi:hypothetical protein
MALRRCAVGMIAAGKQFRRVNGYPHPVKLRAAPDACFTEITAARAGLLLGDLAQVARSTEPSTSITISSSSNGKDVGSSHTREQNPALERQGLELIHSSWPIHDLGDGELD